MKPHVRKALICSAVAFAAAVATLYLTLGPPSSDRGAEAMGRVFALVGMAGLLTGWIARNGSWGWPKFIGVYVLACVALLLLTAPRRVSAAEAIGGAMSLSVKWPAGWHVQHLDGTSSDPADRDLGFRERAVLGDTTPGKESDRVGNVRSKTPPRAVMEFSCHDAGDTPAAPDAALQRILDGARKQFEAKGMTVAVGETTPVNFGTRAGAAATLTMQIGDFNMMQNIGVAPGEGCLLVSNFAASAPEYRAAEDAFSAARASVRLVMP